MPKGLLFAFKSLIVMYYLLINHVALLEVLCYICSILFFFILRRCSDDILSEMEALKCEKVLADVTRRFKENHVS